MAEWHTHFVQALDRQLKKRQKKNPSYSVRRFAQQIGLPAGALSEILKGKRKMTLKRAKQVVDKLNLTDRERHHLLTHMGETHKMKRRPAIEADYDLFTDWRVAALLALLELDEVDRSPRALSERLAISEDYVERKIKELVTRKLLFYDDKGELRSSDEVLDYGAGMPAEIALRSDREALRLAEHAMDRIPPLERGFYYITFIGNEDQRQALIVELKKLFARFVPPAASGAKDQVFRLSAQFFPFDFAGKSKPKRS